jgi:6-pyruvoyltetrahydropterin/6-carboxytetrahydropterin synthase
MRLYKDFRFEAAHALTCVEPDHPCARVHGHSYRARLTFEGPLDAVKGWVFDWGLLDGAIARCLALVDHRSLNDVPDLGKNPTCEHVARWMFDRFAIELATLPATLSSVEVQENPTAGAIYERSDHARDVLGIERREIDRA